MQKLTQPPQEHTTVIRITNRNSHELIQMLKEGLPTSAFTALQKALNISTKQLADTVNISLRTLNRRKKESRLRPDESERVLRIARLFDQAKDLMGDEVLVQQWFKSPKKALQGQTPLEYADTEPGALEVGNLLGRLQHGVFS